MRRCSRSKLGRPLSSSATTSPSSTASCVPSARPSSAQLRVARRDVVAVAALEPQPPAVGVADRAHAVPLDLERPVVAGRQRAQASEHRLDLLRHRLAVRILGRIHPVDHPVLAAGAEEDVLAADALAVEGDHHLRLAPLVQLVRAAVPDAHRARPVLALGDRRRGTRGTRTSGGLRTDTARWLRFRDPAGMPLGTAHDASVPSRSSRRSQCIARAECSCDHETRRVAVAADRGSPAPAQG